MPNYVTNRLEINADRETVQNVMDFLKEKLMKTVRLAILTSTTLSLCQRTY